MGNFISYCIKINNDENRQEHHSTCDTHVGAKSPEMTKFRFQAPIKTRSVSPNKFENIDLD